MLCFRCWNGWSVFWLCFVCRKETCASRMSRKNLMRSFCFFWTGRFVGLFVLEGEMLLLCFFLFYVDFIYCLFGRDIAMCGVNLRLLVDFFVLCIFILVVIDVGLVSLIRIDFCCVV